MISYYEKLSSSTRTKSVDKLVAQIEESGFGKETGKYGKRADVGIKKLLSIIEMARQEPELVAERLTSALMGLKM